MNGLILSDDRRPQRHAEDDGPTAHARSTVSPPSNPSSPTTCHSRIFSATDSRLIRPMVERADTVSLGNHHRAVDLELPHEDQTWTRPVEVVVLLERVKARRSVERSSMGIRLVFERWPHGMNRQQHAPVIT